MELVCLALVTRGAVWGHIMQLKRARDGVAAQLETRHVVSDCLIQRIQPLQVCVEVASGPTSQSDVIPLDGCSRLNGNFLRVIWCDKVETVLSV